MKPPFFPIFLLVISLSALFASCGDDGTGPEQRVLTSFASIAGDAQIDTVAQQLPAAIQVQALDQNGKPMEDVAVNFAVTSGGGEPFAPYSLTDAAGMAYQFWTLGELAGPHTMEARAVAGGTPLALEFSATAVPDRVAWIELSADSVVASRGNIVFMDEVAEFSARAFDRFENLNAQTGFEWSVSDLRLAAISASGVLSPRETGLVVVTAGKDGITAHDTAWIQPTRVPPIITIVQPHDSSSIQAYYHFVQFHAEASDPDGGSIDSVIWESDRDGRMGKGGTITYRFEATGWHRISATAYDDEGASAADTVDVRAETEPEVRIVTPQHAQLFDLGEPISFWGRGTDMDGGTVTLTWTSDIDGVLGMGGEITRSDLSQGVHLIVLTGVDDENMTGATSIHVSVQNLGPGSPGCLAFDFERLPDYTESGDFVEVPDATSLDVRTHWTIEAWINPSSENFEVPHEFRHIISKWNAPGNASYVVQLYMRGASVAVHNGSSTWRTESEEIIWPDSWYHLAAAFSNGLLELYVNGVLVASNQIPTVPMDSDRPVVFGREGLPLGSRYYAGLIDEARIWNVYRSQSEIISTMTTSLAGTESGLVGYWRLDEGSGDTAFDATTNANHGRLGRRDGDDASDPQWTVGGAPINN